MAEGSNSASVVRTRELIAPVRHTVLLVSIFLAVAIAGAIFQRHARPTPSEQHPNVVPLYLSLIAVEWLLVYGVWAGIRTRGVRLTDLIGQRWRNGKGFLIDLVIALMVWILWLGIQAGVSRVVPGSTQSVSALLPQGGLEVVLWIATSLSAGFCEEVTFRGYFQKQFEAMTGSSLLAIILQALLFGVAHGYEGLAAVVMIVLFGLLFGILAFWRKSLRPGMVLHAWSDIYGGYLFQFVRW
jgi:membrane protease YdiL (CAAX protease family)